MCSAEDVEAAKGFNKAMRLARRQGFQHVRGGSARRPPC